MPNFPAWYESTNGPEVSKTIFNIIGSFLPVFDLLLMHFGITIPGLSETINALIATVVFLYFAVQAAIGYVRAKNVLAARVEALASQVRAAGGVPNLGPGQLRV